MGTQAKRDIAHTPDDFSSLEKQRLRAFGMSVGLKLAPFRKRACNAERAAMHEAGHVAVALHTLPDRPIGARIRYDDDDWEHASGEVRDFDLARAPTRERIMNYLGGPAFEAMHYGPPEDGYWADVWNVRELAAVYCIPPAELRLLAGETRKIVRAHKRFIIDVGVALANACEENGDAVLTDKVLRRVFYAKTRADQDAAFRAAFEAALGTAAE